MLEELRVSLFAQELKTSVPVSVKRLQSLWDVGENRGMASITCRFRRGGFSRRSGGHPMETAAAEALHHPYESPSGKSRAVRPWRWRGCHAQSSSNITEPSDVKI